MVARTIWSSDASWGICVRVRTKFSIRKIELVSKENLSNERLLSEKWRAFLLKYLDFQSNRYQ
jgi:hypothetical protein